MGSDGDSSRFIAAGHLGKMHRGLAMVAGEGDRQMPAAREDVSGEALRTGLDDRE